MKGKALISIFLTVLLITGVWSAVYGEEKYPSKPVTIIVTYRPGGGVDMFFRVLAEALKEAWKIPVTVENQFASDGIPAMDMVARSKKDGYTSVGLLAGVITTLTAVKPNGPINVLRDFDPIFINPGIISALFLVKSDSKFKTLKEIVSYAKTRPGELICGTGPRGTENFLEWEMFKRAANVDIPTLPYQSAVEVYTQLLGGHVQIGGGADGSGRPFVESGRLRPLAVDRRSAILPDVPTFAEAGFPEVNIFPTVALLGPKGLPAEVTAAWQNAIKKISKDPNFIASLKKIGANNHIETDPIKQREFFNAEVKKYGQFSPEQLGF